MSVLKASLFSVLLGAHISLSATTYAEERPQARSLLTLSEEEAPYLSKPEGVINQLRWLNLRARAHLLRMGPSSPLTSREANEALQRARLGLMGGEQTEVVLALRQLLTRKGLQGDPSYPLALVTLARAERHQGLTVSAEIHLKAALKASESSPSRYEEALLAHLEQGSSHNLNLLMTFWQRYNQLCERARRPRAERARYHYAKALFELNSLEASEALMSALASQGSYMMRARYFLAVIALKRGQTEEAVKRLEALDALLSKARISAQKRALRAQGALRREVVKRVGALTVSKLTPEDQNQNAQSAQSSYQGGQGGANSELRALQDLSPELREVLARAEKELTADKALTRWGSPPTTQGSKTPLKEPLSVLDEVSAALSLSRARLALVQGDEYQAWQRYREVPVGSAWHQEALLEGVYLLRRRSAPLRAIRLLEQLLSAQEGDISSFQLKMWRAELLVKADFEEEAGERYQRLSEAISREHRAVKTAQESDLTFPPEVLSWVGDDEARLARGIGREVGLMRLYIRQAQAEWNQLYLSTKGGRYEAVERSKTFIKRQEGALNTLKARLPSLKAPWARWSAQRATPLFGLSAREVSVSKVSESVTRLQGRLSLLSKLTQAREAQLQRMLPTWLKNLRDEVAGLSLKLETLKRASARLDQLLKAEALKRVSAAEAQLKLGPTEVYFWRKERASEQLNQGRMSRLSELNALRALATEGRNASAPLSPLEALASAQETLRLTSDPSLLTSQEEPPVEPPSSEEPPLEDSPIEDSPTLP